MKQAAKLSIAVLLLMIATPVIAQRAIQTSDAGQESVDTSPFENGTATLVGVSGVGSFTLGGSDVVIAGVLRDGFVAPTFCSPCTPGSSVSLRSTFGGAITSPLSIGTARFFNRTMNLFFGGQLDFDAGVISVPTQQSRRSIIITVPATATGNVAGYFLNPFIGDPGPPVFVSSVNLQGTATVVLRLNSNYPLNSPQLYTFQSITYNFPPPEERPEDR